MRVAARRRRLRDGTRHAARERDAELGARAQAERTRALRQSFGDSLGGGAEARKEIREAQAREAEGAAERAEAARREERSRRRVHDTSLGARI